MAELVDVGVIADGEVASGVIANCVAATGLGLVVYGMVRRQGRSWGEAEVFGRFMVGHNGQSRREGSPFGRGLLLHHFLRRRHPLLLGTPVVQDFILNLQLLNGSAYI